MLGGPVKRRSLAAVYETGLGALGACRPRSVSELEETVQQVRASVIARDRLV